MKSIKNENTYIYSHVVEIHLLTSICLLLCSVYPFCLSLIPVIYFLKKNCLQDYPAYAYFQHFFFHSSSKSKREYLYKMNSACGCVAATPLTIAVMLNWFIVFSNICIYVLTFNLFPNILAHIRNFLIYDKCMEYNHILLGVWAFTSDRRYFQKLSISLRVFDSEDIFRK